MAHKYNAKKVTVNGIRFDSKKEAARYKELKALEHVGKIDMLELQPRFVLMDGFRYEGKVESRNRHLQGDNEELFSRRHLTATRNLASYCRHDGR